MNKRETKSADLVVRETFLKSILEGVKSSLANTDQIQSSSPQGTIVLVRAASGDLLIYPANLGISQGYSCRSLSEVAYALSKLLDWTDKEGDRTLQ